MTAPAPATAHITGWDRAVIVALGAAGCALSFSALQQMAVAIHVRGPLTYLFPLVIDGFIAYGVRALLVLRSAPLPARLYVWTLFGMATAASIWANALHAVRLNEETRTVTGLRLGDTVVAVLSTVAPLALAGAVHLYILIARGPVKDSDRRDRDGLGRPEHIPVTRADHAGQSHRRPGQVSAGQSVTALSGAAGQDTVRLRVSSDTPRQDNRTVTGGSDRPDRPAAASSVAGRHLPVSGTVDLGRQPDTDPADDGRPVSAGRPVAALSGAAGQDTVRLRVSSDTPRQDNRTVTGDSDRADSPATATGPAVGHRYPGRRGGELGGQPETTPADNDRPVNATPATGHPNSVRQVTDRPVTASPATGRGGRITGDRRSDLDTERLLQIAQKAVRAEDKLTRAVVAQAIRGQQIPLSNDRLTELMVQLRAQHGQPVTTSRT